MICKKEMALKHGQMDPDMKVGMLKVKNKVKEFILGAIYLDMKVIGQKIGLLILYLYRNLYFILKEYQDLVFTHGLMEDNMKYSIKYKYTLYIKKRENG